MAADKNQQTAAYCRLSREDGDRAESDSIANQKAMLEDAIRKIPNLKFYQFYIDDGYTGTNFERPAFHKMTADIESGKIQCVIVKDLSRFGRDYIETGRYLERWLPQHGVRFIALNDHIDSNTGAYDMMLPLKNVFNAQYARDISDKVRTSIRTKQKQGAFVGAFAPYGYRKDALNHNKLVIDPVAAVVIRQVFTLYENGMGKVKIAKWLNEQGIPCPSRYKQLMGEKYHNGQRLGKTTYWTYATVHKMLQNRMYLGDMVQNRYLRADMHGKAKLQDKTQWIIVPDTHVPIISCEQWERVQALMQKKTHSVPFNQNVNVFAGFLKCGDCGRSMVKTVSRGRVSYSCGSYKRYGPSVCSPHYIAYEALEEIVLDDLNQIIESVTNLKILAEESAQLLPQNPTTDPKHIELALEKLYRMKKGCYEDYRQTLLSKEDYLRYKADYEAQEEALKDQLTHMKEEQKDKNPLDQPWVKRLLQKKKLTMLDRVTVAELIETIRVYEQNHIEITYRFSPEVGRLLEQSLEEK